VRRALREPRYGAAVLHAGVSQWREGGWRALELAIATSRPAINDYGAWVRMYDTLSRRDVAAIRRATARLDPAGIPALVIPVTAAERETGRALQRTVASLQRQIEPRWRAVIVTATHAGPDRGQTWEDFRRLGSEPRVSVVAAIADGQGALLNAGLEAVAASGARWFAVLEPGDILPRHALYWLGHACGAAAQSVQLVYTDEDRVVPSRRGPGRWRRFRRTQPCFKPDWSPEEVMAAGGIGRIACLRVEPARAGGGYRDGLGAATELDLLLRLTEDDRTEDGGAESVPDAPVATHVPAVLVHREKWPAPPGDDHVRVVRDHLRRLERAAEVGLDGTSDSVRVSYLLPADAPLVSLVMPTRNAYDLLRATVESLYRATKYPRLELVVVDNGSDEPDAVRFLRELGREGGVRVIASPGEFNYAGLVNAGVEAASGELVALINNDLVAQNPEWLAEMVGIALQPGVGAVGARLWYPNGTLQHGGIVVGLGGVAGHSHKELPSGERGHCGRAVRRHEVSAVTGACLVMDRGLYVELGGLDARDLAVAFNDVDLCLRIWSRGMRVVWTPYADLIHHESASRGAEDSPDKIARFEREIATMKARWGARLAADPYYNPNLTLDREDYSLAWPPRRARPWESTG
jgi:GT2 family glycosyltransferase